MHVLDDFVGSQVLASAAVSETLGGLAKQVYDHLVEHSWDMHSGESICSQREWTIC